jgi:putative hemolysin
MELNNLFKAVMALDLDAIKTKLMHVESGEGWSLARADAVEKEYRRFLCLMKLYPDEDTAPLVDVDTFWHYHILDTMKYASDCERAFGYFLHHYPYVGLRGENDMQFRADSGERMRSLYESTFSEAYPVLHTARTAPAATYRVRYGIGVQEGAMLAWCASPGGKTSASNDATAWCASPGATATARDGAATAWCASPGGKSAASNDATAWCASPGAKDSACAA